MSVARRVKQFPRRLCLVLILLVAILAVIAVVAIIAVKYIPAQDEPPIVTTNCGKVRGRRRLSDEGVEINEFLYIPYATPPLGDRRWTHSSLLQDSWQGEYAADQDRDIKCVQAFWDPPVGQEDCLYLSVKSPDLKGDLPVIVWIHGGSLQYGYAEDKGYSADTDFTAAVNCVTVNINYRLDLLGFLSHPALWEDGQSFGNFGMTDALIALQWVQKNIVAFGGDPKRVTIMGESSGGTLVLGLVASPRAQGLFQKAFSMSSAPFWNSTYEDAYKRRPDFLKQVKCEGFSTNSDIRKCLKSVDVKLLINSSSIEDRGWGFYDFPMSEGEKGESMDYNVQEPFFLPYYPQDIPDKERTNKIELILSNTAQENAFWKIFYDYNNLQNWTIADNLLSKRLETFLGEKNETLLSEIKQKYSFGTDSVDWSPQWFWDTLTTDIRATCPMNHLADRLNSSPNLSVYRLYIEHCPSAVLDRSERWGAWHGWDTEAMFGFKYYNPAEYNETTSHDWQFARDMRSLVKQFAWGGTRDWSTSKTIYLTNSEPWRVDSISKPQSGFCQFWTEKNFDGWGWQN